MRKGPRILVLFLQAFCLKELVPSWHKESCGVCFFSLREYPLEILVIVAGSIWSFCLSLSVRYSCNYSALPEVNKSKATIKSEE
jgi:hypothetical protein